LSPLKRWLVAVSSAPRLIGWRPVSPRRDGRDEGEDDRHAESQDTVAEVVLGVDTHLDFHVAVALDGVGRRLGELTMPTTTKGYEALLSWAERFGPVRSAGLEGTGSYGAGLAQHLRTKGVEVLEVERPKRRHLRRKGKSDPIDAEAAARAVLAGEAVGVPKSGDGRVESIRTLRAVRRSAVKARTQAANQLSSSGAWW
jgi:transposase